MRMKGMGRSWTALPELEVATIWLVVVMLLAVSNTGSAHTNGFSSTSQEGDVRIGVLGLFHPQQFEVKPVSGQALILRAEDKQVLLGTSSGAGSANIRITNADIRIVIGTRNVQADSVIVAGRNGEPADFILSIPGRISRRYRGTLEIKASEGGLLAILNLDRETAVASIVAAESDPDTPIEALKAQAIATRSYLTAGRRRHRGFDFCDTTHCQYLREPPPSGGAVASAVAATRGLILAYDFQPFAAMYSRSCSGQTRTPAQVGLSSSRYPYYSVECPHCRYNPQRWTSRIPIEEASSLHRSDERSRLEIVRRLGWGAVPSSEFVARKDGDEIRLSGAGNGHGIGLCQSGAKAMAKSGASFQDILKHYYPNTAVENFRVN
ncbi:MAG TPA: SpoIID/LytB domain-containing protein [Candidatus Sulfotelmatobacter sp.]|nr:SpoIID/LytB domain-containing protein [Candidatus Sulfotelmatobacter sp.]